MTAKRIHSGTATGTASTVSFTQYYQTILIENRASATDFLSVTTDGVTTATSLGDDCDVIGPNQSLVISNRGTPPAQGEGNAGTGTVVSIITSGTSTPYTISGE